MNKPHKPEVNKPRKQKINKPRATSQNPAVAWEFDPSAYREELHLKYPPQNSWENISIKDSQDFRNLFLGDWELLGNEDRMHLDSSLFRWRNWGSPFDLLHLLWVADKLNVYPPISVLSGLAKAVESYFLAEGEKRFDECLGLVGKKSKRNYFTKSAIRSRDADLCQQMETLIGVWKVIIKVTIEEAAVMVAAANPNSLSEDTIKRLYSNNKNWKELRTIFSALASVHSLCWSTEDRQNFLTSFPVYSLPQRFKSEHPLYNPEDPDS